ncbi:MAG: hypothetical protein QNJ51_15335 [Calothrix sp. MO_167.B12]|nr:hypothetical protein [Calothrix sp. MO_167.B12]
MNTPNLKIKKRFVNYLFINLTVSGLLMLTTIVNGAAQMQVETSSPNNNDKTESANKQLPKQQIKSTKISRIKYLGNFPSDRNNGWSEKLNGVANDAKNWFFTQEKQLWKFPISHNLNKKVTRSQPRAGILKTGIPNALRGYNHYGDLDQYRGFLFIPVEGKGKIPRIAVFKASNLAYVDSYPLRWNGKAQRQSGWVAIHPRTGLLYTSNNIIDRNNNPIFIYKFNLEQLKRGKLQLQTYNKLYLKENNGNKLIIKKYLQGGVFSSNGNTLYIVNGKAKDFNSKDGGIWVFNAKNGKKIIKSSQNGSFKFEFHPGFSKYEEPEGITFWNLDGGRAPGIKGGQIHVILRDNDWTNTDELYLKHYRVHY